MIDWQAIAEFHGCRDIKEWLLSRYAQTVEQRKSGKLSARGLSNLLSAETSDKSNLLGVEASDKSILNKLKELNIPIAPVGGPNFKPRIINASKFGFKTEDELLKHWRYKESKSIKEIYMLVKEHFGGVCWDWFRRKLGKLGIVKKGTRLEGRLWETGYEKDKGTKYHTDFV